MARTVPELEIDNLTHLVRQGAESIGLCWFNFGRTDGEPPSWQTMAEALAALDELLATAKRIRGEIEADIGPKVPKGGAVVPGVGQVGAHGSGKKESYDVDALRRVVIDRLSARVSDDRSVMVDEDGVLREPREIVTRAVSRAVEATMDVCGQTPSKSWRAGSLKGLGIDPAEYRSSEWAGWKVTVTPDIVDTNEEIEDAS